MGILWELSWQSNGFKAFVYYCWGGSECASVPVGVRGELCGRSSLLPPHGCGSRGHTRVPRLCPYPLGHLAGSLSFCTGSHVTQAILKPCGWPWTLNPLAYRTLGLQACTHMPGSMGYILRWQFWCAAANNWNIFSYTCGIMATLDSLFTYVVVAIDKCSL